MQRSESRSIWEKFPLKNVMEFGDYLLEKPTFQYLVIALALMQILSFLHIKPLGLIFLGICTYFYCKNRLNISIQVPPEFAEKCSFIKERIIDIRQTDPTMFCALASSCLGALAVIGHFVTSSMVVVTGLVVAAILSTKYNIKIMKIEPKKFDWSAQLQYDYDEEFMPEANEANLFLLERAGDLASLTLPTEEGDEDKSDEVPSELLIPDSIPEIDENSTDEEADDLLPTVPVSTSEALVKSDETLKFKRSHFKRDSSLSTTSSSSEESLSKGLQFPDHSAVDGPSSSNTVANPITSSHQEPYDVVAIPVNSQTPSLLTNTTYLLPTLMTDLIKGVLGIGSGGLVTHAPPPDLATALDSSDESEFEIIDKEDLE